MVFPRLNGRPTPGSPKLLKWRPFRVGLFLVVLKSLVETALKGRVGVVDRRGVGVGVGIVDG